MNMNPVNFVDPWGTLIYLTGKEPALDFVLFKNFLKDFGVFSVDKKILMSQDGNGRYFIDLPGGKGSLADSTIRKTTSDPNYKNWLNSFTKELKKRPDIYNQELENLFEWMILDREHAPIDFRTGERAHLKNRLFWFDSNPPVNAGSFGGGVTIEPFETQNGHVEIVVNPKNYSSNVGPELPLDVSTIIVHEFGHGMANMLGYYGEKLVTQLDFFGFTKSNDALFTELAIMFENLFRLRLNQKWLRGWHGIYGSEMKTK